MPTKKITDLTQLTDLDATDSFVVNDSGAGADKRVEFSDLQSEVLNGAAIGTSTAVTELQVDNLNLNGNTISSTDTNGNIIIEANGTGDVIVNEGGGDSDFRVEGLSDTDLLFVDASTDRVGISTNAPASTLDVAGDLTIADKIIHSGDTNTSIRFPSADTVTVETAGTERLNIGSTGDFAFKATNTATTYTFGGVDTEANHQISLLAGRRTITDGKFTIYCQLGHSSGATRPQANIEFEAVANGASDINFSTSATGPLVERMTITSNGYLRMASGTGGIQFKGNTSADDALDDYEEGTFTPTYVPAVAFSSITYDTLRTSASYTKIGNMVFCQIRLETQSISGGSGAVKIGNLPFASKTQTPATSAYGGAVVFADAFSGDTPTSARIPSSGVTELDLYYRSSSNGGFTALDVSDLGTGADDNQLNLTIAYEAA